MSTLQNLEQVLSRKQEVKNGDPAGVGKQKKAGKLAARDRIAMLLDEGSFVEQAMLASDAGVVTGMGTVGGRSVMVFAQDYTVKNGAVGKKQADKIVKVLNQARKTGAPVVAICDSDGARLDEGVEALEAYSDIFAHMARLSGVVPMIAVVAGPCAGIAAVMAEMADVAIVAKPAGAVLSAGPQVLSSAMNQNLSAEELGGGKTAVANGAAHFACESEEDALKLAAKVIDLLPANNLEEAPYGMEESTDRKLEGLESGAEGKNVMEQMADKGSLLELGAGYTQAVTALGRMNGQTVAFVYTGKGDLCDKRMKKITRFVRFADCYNIPVISLVDATGIKVFDSIGRQMSATSAAAGLIYAYSEATTAKVTVVIGKAIGAAYVAMGGSANADATFAWPGTVIGPVAGEAAIQIMWKDRIMESKGDAVEARKALAAEYEAEVMDGVHAAESGLVDDVIDPADTRRVVAATLEMLSGKRDSNPPKKHDNMPL